LFTRSTIFSFDWSHDNFLCHHLHSTLSNLVSMVIGWERGEFPTSLKSSSRSLRFSARLTAQPLCRLLPASPSIAFNPYGGFYLLILVLTFHPRKKRYYYSPSLSSSSHLIFTFYIDIIVLYWFLQLKLQS